MNNPIRKRTKEELFNTATHLLGVVFTLSMAWLIIKLGYSASWQHAFGVTFFTSGMLLMFAASTLYHWWLPGEGETTSAYLRSYRHLYHDCCFVYTYMYRSCWRCARMDGFRTSMGYGYRRGFLQNYSYQQIPSAFAHYLFSDGMVGGLHCRASI